jgi:very-short-patch-repair endonuclease
MSHLEDLMTLWLRSQKNMPPWETEYRFHPKRRWRLDFAWPDRKVALEIEGGNYAGGRHTSGAGFEKDCEKYNEAACLGWTVLRATGKHVKDGRAMAWLTRILLDKHG